MAKSEGTLQRHVKQCSKQPQAALVFQHLQGDKTAFEGWVKLPTRSCTNSMAFYREYGNLKKTDA